MSHVTCEWHVFRSVTHLTMIRCESVMSHVNESFHTCTWVMSHVDESWRIFKWVMSHGNDTSSEVSHIWHMITCEWVMRYIWSSHVTHVNESCYTSEGVMSHAWISPSHMWMRHVTHVNESCYTSERVTSHMWMSHFTHANVSCHTCELQYGVAMISRLLTITGLFCRILSLL